MADDSPIYDKTGKFTSISSWADVLANWQGCLENLSEHDSRASLLSRLSIAQRTCLLVLEEWWRYWCEDWIRHAILSHVAEPATIPLDPTNIICLPQRKLYNLWAWEFSNIYYNSGIIREDLRTAIQSRVRRFAVEAAAVHRTALLALRSVAVEITPSYSSDGTEIRPNLQAHLNSQIAACVEPCPWIKNSTGIHDYPYYLWDKVNRRTVHFEENIPPYTVVSHTWGRFRIRDKEAHIPNVPWPVPCLDSSLLFDIESLPEILSHFPIQTRYIWLDLVCIPQDGRPLQIIEIGRQAGIFRAAQFAVAWLNQIHDWNGLRSAVFWSSMEYLRQYQDDLYGVADRLPSARENASRSLGLTRPARQEAEGTPESPWVFSNKNEQTVTPDRWFTSLWTLQEACLRPDMILCNKNWEVFGMGTKGTQTPILLDHVIALSSRPHGPRATQIPAAVYELRLVLGSSNMSNLLTMSPVDILGLGQMRYCANTDRAIAIMSALGVTDWYNNREGYETEPRLMKLVGGQYPLGFLREFHRRFGAMTFATLDVVNLEETFYEASCLKDVDIDCLRGSMLPFSKGMQGPKFLGEEIVSPTDHPTISDWIIQADGSVKILRAGIISSSYSPQDRPKPATIFPRPMLQTQASDDLVTWMKSFRPNSEKYAICLLRNMANIYRGVILERVDPGRNDFINVGSFYTNEHDPSSFADFDFESWSNVDWLVL